MVICAYNEVFNFPWWWVQNDAELAGMRAAHLRDGAACVTFWAWLDKQVSRSKGQQGSKLVRCLYRHRVMTWAGMCLYGGSDAAAVRRCRVFRAVQNRCPTEAQSRVRRGEKRGWGAHVEGDDTPWLAAVVGGAGRGSCD